MWIMTKIGFFSMVEKPKGQICIRSRSVKDMIDLQKKVFPDYNILHTPKADYPYRLIVPIKYFRSEFGKLANTVDYPNFKSEVGSKNSHRENLYHQVWAILTQIEQESNWDE
jgi:hypothetical protein